MSKFKKKIKVIEQAVEHRSSQIIDGTQQEMTLQKKVFIESYMQNGNNAMKAYLTMYPMSAPQAARIKGLQLESDPEIQAELLYRETQILDRLQLNSEYVLKGLTTIVDRCLQHRPKMVIDHQTGMEVQARTKEGDLLFEFDPAPAIKALELLGRYLRMWEPVQQVNSKEDQSLSERYRRAVENLKVKNIEYERSKE